MNKSLATLALAAIVLKPTSAVKTEWMDNAFSFFDKPLWSNSKANAINAIWGNGSTSTSST